MLKVPDDIDFTFLPVSLTEQEEAELTAQIKQIKAARPPKRKAKK